MVLRYPSVAHDAGGTRHPSCSGGSPSINTSAPPHLRPMDSPHHPTDSPQRPRRRELGQMLQLSNLLRLDSPQREQDFWSSETASRTMRALDGCGLASFALVTSSAFASAITASAAWPEYATACLLLLLHLWVVVLRGSNHQHRRLRLVVLLRIVQMVHTSLTCQTAAWLEALQTLSLGPTTAVLLLLTAAPLNTLMNSLAYMLPFYLQLPMVALKTGLDVVLTAPVLSCVLRTSGINRQAEAALEDACYYILGPMFGSSERRDILTDGVPACKQHGALIVIVFTTVLLGLSLPCLVSYLLERQLKARYLSRLGLINDDGSDDDDSPRPRPEEGQFYVPGIVLRTLTMYLLLLSCGVVAALAIRLPMSDHDTCTCGLLSQ